MTDSAGVRLRAAILEIYELDAGELVLLDQAAALADALERVNAQVAGLDVLTAEGSAGQEVEHPLLKTQRDYSAALARLVDGLRLPVPGASPDDEGEARVTRLARRAANARWSKEKSDG